MNVGRVGKVLVESKPLYIRKLTKSGNTRYLSIGTIIPAEWENIKIVVEEQSKDVCILKLEPIR